MALINCPECGKEVSDSAEMCPNCGYSIVIEEYITEGIISIIVGIVGWIIALWINQGILLVIPFLLFCFSILLDKKCQKRFSIIGFIISSLGILLLLITFIFL